MFIYIKHSIDSNINTIHSISTLKACKHTIIRIYFIYVLMKYMSTVHTISTAIVKTSKLTFPYTISMIFGTKPHRRRIAFVQSYNASPLVVYCACIIIINTNKKR